MVAAARLTIVCSLLVCFITLLPSAPSNAQIFARPGRSAHLQTHTYVPDPSDVPNPERGFRPSFDDLDPSHEWAYINASQNGHRLIYAYVYLAPYRDNDTLPASLLTRIDHALDAVRRQGLKAILRFAYNFGPWPDSEPDAPLPRILAHIQQVAPVLQENADVIAWFHAGFIGAWGEWHTSTHELHADPNAKLQVLQALADAVPGKFIQLRYPRDIRYFFPTPLTSDTAFANTLHARTGFHNDCFLSSETDYGTYHPSPSDSNSRVNALAYLNQNTQFVPAGGETCALYTPLQNCSRAIQEMETLHLTDLNISYHPNVISYWGNGGCLDTMRKRLGYRLVLRSAAFPNSVLPG
ncbi:MAG: DUF4874 domain-containing protein, partial [Thermoflexales bacterium]|nr:DUF4874 domain-containing protein [Thermoflexales bacterium]